MDTCRLEARSGRVPEPPHDAAGEVYMRIQRQRHADGSRSVTLLEDDGEPISVVSGFLRHLAARDCSPNTLVAYAYDLRHLWMFLAGHGLAWQELRPRHAFDLLEYPEDVKVFETRRARKSGREQDLLRWVDVSRPRQRRGHW